MADETKHGDPVDLGSRTGEAWGKAPLSVEIDIDFYFVAPDGRKVPIPKDKVPPRARDRVIQYVIEGPDGYSNGPSNPQLNTAQKFLPPASAEVDAGK